MATLNHSIVTGQSLAVGSVAATVSPADQANPSNVLTLDSSGNPVALTSPAATQEPGRTLAEKSFLLGLNTYRISVNTHAAGGQAYSVLKKGGTGPYYAQAIARAQLGHDVAVAAGDTFKARSVHFIHGEQDQSDGKTADQYAGYLAEWISDYRTDLLAMTGQVETVVGFACQIRQAGATEQNVSNGQADAHYAGSISLVTPKYHLPSGDGTHLTAAGYYYLGEYHGRAYNTEVIGGTRWEPVLPSAYTWSYTAGGDLKLVVDFTAPTGPLVFDTTTVAAQTNYGFALRDDYGSHAFKSIALTGDKQVTFTLNRRPTGTARLSYGRSANKGNLRDSDTMVSLLDGTALQNWCCKFDRAITPALATLRQHSKTGAVRLA